MYTLKNGAEIDPIHVMSIYHFKPGTLLIQRYRSYLDVGPLLKAFASA